MGLDTEPSTYTGRRRSSSVTMERSAPGSGCCRFARRRTRRPAPGCWSYKGYACRAWFSSSVVAWTMLLAG
jgi:hypothetical protein